jgi:hypothetical protein
MQHPDVHLDYTRSRHSDLLRRARVGELASKMAQSRSDDRRFFLARRRDLALRRQPSTPSAST